MHAPGGSGDKILSPREDLVLRALASGKLACEIAVELNLSAKTVSTYKRRTFDKLHLHSTADLIRYAVDRRF